jgi:hypothetical protein
MLYTCDGLVEVQTRLFPVMPNTLLSLPALYTIVGVYRLVEDPKIRNPVWVSWGPGHPTRRTNLNFRRTNVAMERDVGFLLLQYTYVSAVIECFELGGVFQSDTRIWNLGRCDVWPTALVCFDVSFKVSGISIKP